MLLDLCRSGSVSVGSNGNVREGMHCPGPWVFSVCRADLEIHSRTLMDPFSTESVEPAFREGDPEDHSRIRRSWGPFAAVVGLVMVAGLALVLGSFRVPYYALWPGPVEEVSDLVRIEGGPRTYELNGDVYMLTVSLQEVNAFEFAQGWIDSEVDLVRRELIRPEGVTPEEHRKKNLRLMDDSKLTAIAVAMDYLGLPVQYSGEGVLVLSVAEGAPADGLLEVGDVIVEIADTEVSMRDEAIEAILAKQVGDTIALTVRRADELIELEVTLGGHTDDPGQPMVGFVPDTLNPALDLPFDIEIHTEGTGGPSAGVMYALTLIDLLSADDLIAGNIVAGTGTISPDGRVGPIGGIRQKVVAAQNAGALHVLVPEPNYEDALTVKREDVEIYAVSSITDAVDVLKEIPAA